VCAAPEQLVGELGEPALDEVQPRARRRREVQLKARVGGQPALDLRRLVRRAVVEHQVDVQVRPHLAIDRLQELLELDRAVACVQAAEDLAGRQIPAPRTDSRCRGRL
jgi:hypothetical protein